MKKLLATRVVAMTLASLVPPPPPPQSLPVPGPARRLGAWTSFPPYYCGKDASACSRNDKTYFTWYSNFNNVKFVTDADLSKIQIKNVTYAPGVHIKINTDPKTYAIGRGGARNG